MHLYWEEVKKILQKWAAAVQIKGQIGAVWCLLLCLLRNALFRDGSYEFCTPLHCRCHATSCILRFLNTIKYIDRSFFFIKNINIKTKSSQKINLHFVVFFFTSVVYHKNMANIFFLLFYYFLITTYRVIQEYPNSYSTIRVRILLKHTVM